MFFLPNLFSERNRAVMAKSQTKPETEETTEQPDLASTLASTVALLARVVERLESGTSGNAEVTAQLAKISGQLAITNDSKELARKRELKRLNFSRDLSLRIGRAEQKLIEGTRKYKIGLMNEPVMFAFVGTNLPAESGSLEAQAKYLKHYGITGFEGRSQDRIIVEEISELPSLDDESAWPPQQLKRLRDMREMESTPVAAV
jgi:hypothetical protein